MYGKIFFVTCRVFGKGKEWQLLKNNEIYSLSLAASLAALGAVLVIIGGFFEVIDLTFASAASLTVLVAREELSGKYPFLVYAVASAAALIFMPFRSTTLYFVLFLGYYPILKPYLDGLKKKSKALGLILKFTVFNAIICVLFLLTKLFIETDEVYTPMTIISAILLENLFMVCYDVFLNATTVIYRYRIKGKIFKRHK